MPSPCSLLLIEDSPGECELFRLALAEARLDVVLSVAHDAEAAREYLADQVGGHRLPSVILLDWHLRHTRGDEFLMRLRSDASLAYIPVVVCTTSDDASDMAAAYRCGANSYVVKPGTFDQLVRFVGDLGGYWLQWNRAHSKMVSPC